MNRVILLTVNVHGTSPEEAAHPGAALSRASHMAATPIASASHAFSIF